MFINCFPLVMLNMALGSPQTIQTEYGENFFVRFPVLFTNSDDEYDFPGTAQLELGARERSQTFTRSVLADTLDVNEMRLGGNIILDLGHRGRVVDIQSPILEISASPFSVLMENANGYLLTPTSSSSGLFVIDPVSPRDYVLGGEIFYSGVESNFYWQIRMAVRLLPSANSDDLTNFDPQNTLFGTCKVRDELSTDSRLGRHEVDQISHIIVPQHVMDGLHEQFRELGISSVRAGLVGTRLENFSDNFFHNLPKIQFIMETDDQRYMSLVVLEPHEYIVRLASGNYFLRIRALNRPDANACTIDRSILKKLVVHFDVQNHRIGFGEPLVEL